ncbi:MAG: CopG family transcriptional regulator [Desulfobacteraceae bacterium]|nr:MAG: CopG family transcriptional regulator [Desulfobacteraceae bacterium]
MKNARTIVTLSREEKNWLEKYSANTGISMAEAIRRGIMCLREQTRPSAYQDALESSRGIWKKGDGLQYQKNLRAEWQ